MKGSEILHLILAVIVLFIIISFKEIISLNALAVGFAILFSFLIIVFNVAAKKFMASQLDAGVEHRLWYWSRYGMMPGWHLEKAVPAGIIFPLVVTAFSLGAAKLMTILTYETNALKRRAARRFGRYSFTEITEWHNALIGAAGIIATLALSFIAYWIPSFEPLARFAAFYAFFNMLPISKLDGTQIYMGSRVLWWTLAVVTLIFTFYALLLP